MIKAIFCLHKSTPFDKLPNGVFCRILSAAGRPQSGEKQKSAPTGRFLQVFVSSAFKRTYDKAALRQAEGLLFGAGAAQLGQALRREAVHQVCHLSSERLFQFRV